MGYRITYGPKRKPYIEKKDKQFSKVYLSVVFFAVFLIFVHYAWPEGWNLIKWIILPDWKVWACLENFTCELFAGGSFQETINCFWQEICENAFCFN